jgi:hypothetical protein
MSLKTVLLVEKFTIRKTEKALEQPKEVVAMLKKKAATSTIKAQAKVEPEPVRVMQDEQERWRYSAKIILVKDEYRSEAAGLEALNAAEIAVRKNCEAVGWRVLGDAADIAQQEAAAAERVPLVLPELTNRTIKNEFSGIYRRESHIHLIHDCARLAVDTQFVEREHTLLWGEPAAAKTVLFIRLKNFYEKHCPGEHVAMVDATSVTKAGLENWIIGKAKMGTLPPFICLEEIEKYQPENLLCLLSIMDTRGEIRKMNAKIGDVMKKTPVVIWATCNDIEALRNFHKGALLSRFTNQMECVRPPREDQVKICLDKIAEWRKMGVEMDDRCAQVAVDYAYDVMATDDPRAIKRLLSGRNGLLDGTMFARMNEIADQSKKNKELKAGFAAGKV